VTTGKVEPRDQHTGYIRGAGGIPVSGRRVGRIVIGCCLVSLATLVVVLTIGAAGQNSRISRLQRHGVAVDVTVTSCFGIASGTGISATGFRCSGTFTLNGRSYTDVIGGTAAEYSIGEKVQLVSEWFIECVLFFV
jgi:hypothetical protein